MLPTATRSGYAPVNGVEVFYAVYGEGRPLVLLHGGLGQIEMFGPVLAALAANRQVIGIDLQAHGRTLPMERPMTYEAMAADVAGVIAYLGLERVDLVGYSMGGGVALRTALDTPDLVERLVLVSTPFAFSGWHAYNSEGMQSMSSALAEPMKSTPMYRDYAAIAPDVANWPVLLDKIGAFIGRDYDWSSEIAGLRSPTLLIVGDYDAIRIQHTVHFFELLGGGKADGGWDGSGMTPNRLAVLPGATHYLIYSDPRLADTILSFLNAD